MSTSAKTSALILVLCGLPASGKSTLAKHIISAARSHRVTAVHLCLDDILLCDTSGQDLQDADTTAVAFGAQGAHGNAAYAREEADAAAFSASAWQVGRQKLLWQAQEHLQLASQQQDSSSAQQDPDIERPLLLVIDDVNHLRSMRYECVQLARTSKAAFLQIHLDCSVELALERNRHRTGSTHIPETVIRRLATAFEPPAPEKHHWEADSRTWTLDCSNVPQDADKLWQVLLQHWGAVMPPPLTEEELRQRRLAGTAANAASVVHSFDLETRSMLSRALATVDQSIRAIAAQQLNTQRKKLLDQLRCQVEMEHNSSTVAPAADDNSMGASMRAGAEAKRLLEQFRVLCEGFK